MTQVQLKNHASTSETTYPILIPTSKVQDWDVLRASLNRLNISLPYFDQGDFQGEKDESITLYTDDQRKIILIGLGEKESFACGQKALRGFRVKSRKKIKGPVFISLALIEDKETVKGIANGWQQGGYDVQLYKTENGKIEDHGVIFLSDLDDQEIESVISQGVHLALTQMKVLDLVNAPANRKTPIELAEWSRKSAEEFGYQCQILEKDELESLGFHALLAVNRGSEVPAKCLLLDHTPSEYSKTVVLVGKGVTFDTGGLSIKGGRNMHYMKSDMGGAAAVMGALEVSAKMNVPVRVIGIVPTTDNSVDAKSVKPGDVIDSYSGKTIEVLNTDAEGRLILADGLAYAIKNYEPDHLIDLATLTGNVIQALGTEAAGLYTNDDQLANIIDGAGQKSGERVWRLPIWDGYFESMKSDIADVSNLSDKPMAGSITAAKFLQFFTADHKSWAHLDIAGMAFGPNPLSKGYSATSFGVHLLLETILKLA